MSIPGSRLLVEPDHILTKFDTWSIVLISTTVYMSGVVMSETDVRDRVRSHYAAAADAGGSCCGDDPCCGSEEQANFGVSLYRAEDLNLVPDSAATMSLGCGNPTAVADLAAGETVLDLGSGGGIDVLLAAQRVGPDGFVYGLDMTDEMLALARDNAAKAGAANVSFLKGFIEEIPLEADTVDVVISNCVINLSANKDRVFAEMARVTRPGGRIGVSDVVADDALSAEEREEGGSWVGCVAGALSFSEYAEGLRRAGFSDITIRPTHGVAEGMHSAIIRATKPVG